VRIVTASQRDSSRWSTIVSLARTAHRELVASRITPRGLTAMGPTTLRQLDSAEAGRRVLVGFTAMLDHLKLLAQDGGRRREHEDVNEKPHVRYPSPLSLVLLSCHESYHCSCLTLF
jgi:hypothetical protein